MRLSVVIPCLNNERSIGELLDSLASQILPGWDWEIVVSDNGSTDGTRAVVERYRDRLDIKVVESSGRRGVAYARNTGVRHSTGDVIVFCDADDVVCKGWLAAMGSALERYDMVAGPLENTRLNRKERYLDWSPQQDGLQSYTYPRYLPHAAGANLGVRRLLFDAVGGFDESLRFVQDTDFCWKVQLRGVKIHFAPEAVVYYRHRCTLRKLFMQFFNWGQYNVALYKRYSTRGMPRLPWHSGLVSWLRLLKRLPRFLLRGSRQTMLRELGWKLGRLYGSIRFWTFAL